MDLRSGRINPINGIDGGVEAWRLPKEGVDIEKGQGDTMMVYMVKGNMSRKTRRTNRGA